MVEALGGGRHVQLIAHVAVPFIFREQFENITLLSFFGKVIAGYIDAFAVYSLEDGNVVVLEAVDNQT